MVKSVQPLRASRAVSHRREDGERGAMNVVAIPAVVGLLALATVLIVVLGSATSDKRESTTAADAAALAAAQEWDRRVHGIFDWYVGLDSHVGWWALAGRPGLSAETHTAMRAAAASYASRNGAELIEFDVDDSDLEVYVRVRNRDTVPETSNRIEAEATARLELTGGLCIENRRLGYWFAGWCHTTPVPEPTPTPTPTPTETPDPDPGATPSPEPTETTPPEPPPFVAPSVGAYRHQVILVD